MSKNMLKMNEKPTIKHRILDLGNTLSLTIALLLLSSVWGILSEHFFTMQNIMNVLMLASVLAIRAAGLTVAMIMGGMDVSQNSIGAVVALLAAIASDSGAPWWAVVLLVLVVSPLMGAVNATLITFFRIAPIITTLGTMQIFRGAAWLISNTTIMLRDPVQLEFGRGRLFGVMPYMALIAIAILGITYFILKYTTFGREVYMVGGNENASYLCGINAKKVKFIAFVFSGLTAGIAGYLLSCQVGAALPQSGAGTEMLTISAVILGGVSLAGGKGKISGTILGVLILQVINNGLTLQGIDHYWQMVVSGLVLVLAVLIDVIRSGVLKK